MNEATSSRTRRMISNVRITERNGAMLKVEANFTVHRFRRNEGIRAFVGHYRYVLRADGGRLSGADRIAQRLAGEDQLAFRVLHAAVERLDGDHLRVIEAVLGLARLTFQHREVHLAGSRVVQEAFLQRVAGVRHQVVDERRLRR